MAARRDSNIILRPNTEAEVEQPNQLQRPEMGQFGLRVDEQTKSSHSTLEAAEKAGLAIKKGFPLVQVTVYDTQSGMKKTIELPE